MYNRVLKNLILSFRRQDVGAFELIYDEFKNIIYYYARKQNNEDIVGELTLFLIELLYRINLGNFKSDISVDLRKYISVSLKNKYISILRKQMKDSLILRDVYEEDLIYNNPAPMYLDICDAFENLTERQKSVVVCKYIYCLSEKQISQMLNISRQAVNRLKNKALDVLKEYYSE